MIVMSVFFHLSITPVIFHGSPFVKFNIFYMGNYRNVTVFWSFFLTKKKMLSKIKQYYYYYYYGYVTEWGAFCLFLNDYVELICSDSHHPYVAVSFIVVCFNNNSQGHYHLSIHRYESQCTDVSHQTLIIPSVNVTFLLGKQSHMWGCV